MRQAAAAADLAAGVGRARLRIREDTAAAQVAPRHGMKMKMKRLDEISDYCRREGVPLAHRFHIAVAILPSLEPSPRVRATLLHAGPRRLLTKSLSWWSWWWRRSCLALGVLVPVLPWWS